MCLSVGGPLPPLLKLLPLCGAHLPAAQFEFQFHRGMDAVFCFINLTITDGPPVVESTCSFREHKTRQEHGLYPPERRCSFWPVDSLVFDAISDAGYFYSHNIPEKKAKLLLFPFVG